MGSVATPEHTLVSNSAVRSLTSLCLIEGYPPFGHDKDSLTYVPYVPQRVEIALKILRT